MSPPPIPSALPRATSRLCAALAGVLAATGWLRAADAPAAADTGTPPVVGFEVQRYEVTGSDALDPAEVNRLLKDATGSRVSIPRIRAALERLQEAYRERGVPVAGIVLPRQSPADGTVRLRVQTVATTSAGELPAYTVPTYDIRHFVVRGNTVLSADEIDRLLSPAASSATAVTGLDEALRRLQAAYVERGRPNATVRIPDQILTDGQVAIEVDEGRNPAEAAVAARPAETVNPTPPTKPAGDGPAFEVRRYEVIGNTLLAPEVVDRILTNSTAAAITFPTIRKALGELQLAYRERGFATASVALPQQRLTNGVVRVQVIEGRLVDIQLAGNRHFSSNNVMKTLPSLRTNEVLNSTIFQRELDIANQNRDRQIYPTVGPGPEPGTSALTLRVKDRLPLHGRLDLNNQSTPGTPEWRVNASGQYNNLWQLEHQVGISYGFTPEAMKSDDGVPDDWPIRPGYWLSRPLVANYGAYYRLPFGRAESLEDRIRSSTAFGYDEATHQFRLPPAGARPELSVYASEASSDTGVHFAPAQLVSRTPLLTILSRDSGRDVSLNQSAGARVSVPWVISDTRRLAFSAGPDWKLYKLESFNTNNFLITTVITNVQGSQTIQSQVSSPQPSRRNEVQYLPLAAGLDYSQSDASGSFSASLGIGGNFVGDSADFAALAYSTNAAANYARATLNLTRDQKLPRDWSLLVRLSGQAASGALVSNEQFAVGGLNSVRGYYEGDQYGDSGWFGSLEIRTPYLNTPVPLWSGSVPAWIRGSVFVDYGQRLLIEDVPGSGRTLSLWGAGVGISANVNNQLDLRVAIGWPLLGTPNSEARDPRAYFSIGGQF